MAERKQKFFCQKDRVTIKLSLKMVSVSDMLTGLVGKLNPTGQATVIPIDLSSDQLVAMLLNHNVKLSLNDLDAAHLYLKMNLGPSCLIYSRPPIDMIGKAKKLIRVVAFPKFEVPLTVAPEGSFSLAYPESLNEHQAISWAVRWGEKGSSNRWWFTQMLETPQYDFSYKGKYPFQVFETIAFIYVITPAPSAWSELVSTCSLQPSNAAWKTRLFTPDGQKWKYCGHTIKGQIVCVTGKKDTPKTVGIANLDQRLRIEPPVHRSKFMQVVDARPWDPERPDYRNQFRVICLRLLLQLSTQTIRGVPLMDLLFHLHCGTGRIVPVCIVGGAVRDAWTGTRINDVDLTIGLPWVDMEVTIKEFFVKHGVAMTEDILQNKNRRKQFGMVKINPQAKEDPLDIAPFKSYKVKTIIYDHLLDATNSEALIKAASPSEYLYGFSFDADAESRDYSINAIYFDVFQECLIDPRNGLGHLGKPDSGSFDIHPAATDERVFIDDLGGRMRLWKLILKKGVASPDLISLTCHHLLSEVHRFYQIKSISVPFALTGNVPDEPLQASIDAGEFWLRRLAKKLFNGDEDDLQTKARAENLWEHVQATGIPLAIQWFYGLSQLCVLIKTKESPLLCYLNNDRYEDRWTYRVVSQIAALNITDPNVVPNSYKNIFRNGALIENTSIDPTPYVWSYKKK